MEQIMAVVLAAGKGTRLQTEQNHTAKVLREANGKPLLHYVLNALDFVPREQTVLVVGYQREAVMAAFPGCRYAVQEPQQGTGDAVRAAKSELIGFDGTVLVAYGDMPLLKKEVYQGLLAAHEASGAACTLLAGTSDVALPYGRVLRRPDGSFDRVVEERDCTPEQAKIRELNVGIYAFSGKLLPAALDRLTNNNAQNEYYLTDVPAILRDDFGGKIEVYTAELGEQIIGVNTQEQLDLTEAYLRAREG
jgi:bifunctional UDP-N-acetylglucosamine pyrophosphorylase/glucosamine-1-phosphate N-acetyltransferase/UDP-N-acetylglucosamine pyrophosphorylase